jgi:hypothetical protein
MIASKYVNGFLQLAIFSDKADITPVALQVRVSPMDIETVIKQLDDVIKDHDFSMEYYHTDKMAKFIYDKGLIYSVKLYDKFLIITALNNFYNIAIGTQNTGYIHFSVLVELKAAILNAYKEWEERDVDIDD